MGKKLWRRGEKGFKICEWVLGSLSALRNYQRTDRETVNNDIWEDARPDARISLMGSVLICVIYSVALLSER